MPRGASMGTHALDLCVQLGDLMQFGDLMSERLCLPLG